jgi:hypothetical protein
MRKKVAFLIVLVGIIGGCVVTETSIEIVEPVTIEGQVCVDGVPIDNELSELLIDETLRLLGDGWALREGWENYWVWSKVDGSSSWKKVSTVYKAGGGDTADYITMAGTYVASIGISYDSVLQWRGGTRWQQHSGSPPDTGYVSSWYTLKHDTTVLESSGTIQADWTITVVASGSLLDTLEWHLAYGIQCGYAEEMDSMRLCFANGDSTILPVTVYYDLPNDTISFVAIDTPRSIANDTLKTVSLMDESGTIMSNYATNAHISSGSTPKVTYKLPVKEH